MVVYNTFRWYRAGWGRYTQSDPLDFEGGDINLYRYALANPLRFADPLGLDVRLCCRPVQSRLLQRWDHCYVESNTLGRRETWGLYYNSSNGKGEPLKNREPKGGARCTKWFPESCDENSYWTDAMNRYPVEDYSRVNANRTYFGMSARSGRNSNTFARCLWKRCGPSLHPSDTMGVIDLAPGWTQPCPAF